MQTFLPYADFKKSAECLDRARLGKQRVECIQILNAIYKGGGWANHPAVRMWRGHEGALLSYYQTIVDEWCRRGYRHNMRVDTKILAALRNRPYAKPQWFGVDMFHESHQSNLIRKMPGHYAAMWPLVPNNLPYVWPVDKAMRCTCMSSDFIAITWPM